MIKHYLCKLEFQFEYSERAGFFLGILTNYRVEIQATDRRSLETQEQLSENSRRSCLVREQGRKEAGAVNGWTVEVFPNDWAGGVAGGPPVDGGRGGRAVETAVDMPTY